MTVQKSNGIGWIVVTSLLSGLLWSSNASARTLVTDEPVIWAKDVISKCKDFCDVQITMSPEPGQTLVLRQKEVIAYLDTAGFSVKKQIIPKRTRIQRAFRRAESTELTRLTRHAIEAVLPKGATLEKLGKIHGGKVPKGDLQVRTEFDGSKQFMRSVSVPVTFMSKDVPFRKVYVICRLTYNVQIPVAARPIAKDEILSAAALTYKNIQFNNTTNRFVVDSHQIIGTRSRVAIQQGDAFEQRNLAPIPVVHRGDAVTLVSRTRGIKILVRGYARQNAIKGQRIAVEIPSLNKLLFAKIVSSGFGVVQQ